MLLIPFIGSHWARLAQGQHTILHPCLGWLETLSYRAAAINPQEEMTWRKYAKTLLLFNFIGAAFLFLQLTWQAYLPFNPEQLGNVPWPLAINIVASFITSTNWQSYAGETTLSYGTQMVGLTVQNFLSAATGSAVLMALIRGIIRRTSDFIGNFWTDFVRSVVYLLLPLSIVFAVFLVTQGVVQTLRPYVQVETLENAQQVIPLGPVASQAAIKQLGANGGGFFNANSAHPLENPTPLSNFFQTLAIILIPASLVYGYGILVNSRKQAWMLLGVMFTFWLVSFAVALYSESVANPILEAFPLMEGKESRFKIVDSVLWTVLTSVSCNGSVNSMLESLSPLAGGAALFNILLGAGVLGPVGIGLCTMLIFVLLTMFLCGLMVGRTPEFLGKKIEKREVQWIMLSVLTPSVLILVGAGISCVLPIAKEGISASGPHGLTEVIYAFSSAAWNNGSAFAGIRANTNFYNLSLAFVMILGWLSIIIPSLALAGGFAEKKATPPSAALLSASSVLFGVLLWCVIFIACASTFFPILSLGPIVEHLLMLQGQAFPASGL